LMPIPRRAQPGALKLNFLRAVAMAAASALIAITVPARAAYPDRPIRLIIPQAASGSTDTLSRMVGQKLADALGQQIVSDNRPGANGIIGTELAAKAQADGYTLLAGGTAPIAINPSFYRKIPYDPVKDFTPVANIAYSTSVLVVHPSTGVNSLAEFIALAKSKPGALHYGSAGIGSSPHLSAVLFSLQTGVNIVHVPYKGSTPGVIATVSGETAFMFTGIASVIAHIKSNRLRVLSVNGPKRSAALPEVPTAGEAGLPGFEVDFWIGYLTRTGTPRAIIERLNSEVNKIIRQPDIRERMIVLGTEPIGGTAEQFDALIKADVAKWSRAIKTANIRAD